MRTAYTIRRLFLLLLLAAPLAAAGWGGRLHMDIARAAARGVPDEMEGWRSYAKFMASHSIQPDLWKGYDTSEDFRHFIDLESYVPLAVTNLPPDRASVREVLGKKAEQRGYVPWVIMDLQGKLTAAMAASQWVEAARFAAAQGHYVADVHQPLHTTENYNGQHSGQIGVHLRWEVEMPNIYWRIGMMPEVHAEYLTNLWPTLLGWIEQSHSRIPEIFDADDKAARQTEFNVESRAYYFHLWQASSNLFIEQAHLGACHLASLWYTAWVDAGRPGIAPPPDSLSEASIWKTVPLTGDTTSWPFLMAFGVIAVLIILLSLRRRPIPPAKSRPL
jgi:hypothetical protein